MNDEPKVLRRAKVQKRIDDLYVALYFTTDVKMAEKLGQRIKEAEAEAERIDQENQS